MWRHWWRELSGRYRLVRYDERGCGLSDWDVEDFSLDAWVADLETVVDAAGLDRFALLGISQGGPVAIDLRRTTPRTGQRPDPLRHLHAGSPDPGHDGAEHEDEARVQVQLVRLGWGQDNPAFRRVFAMQFMPEGTQRAVGGLRRAAAPDDVHRQRRAVRGGVQRHRRRRPRRPRVRRRAW